MIENLGFSPLPIPAARPCCWRVLDKRTGEERWCHWPAAEGRDFCAAHPGKRLPARPSNVVQFPKLSHSQVVRIIAGACDNAAHAHPDWYIDPRLYRSIAKRAAGTLLAAMPDVLAAPGASSLSSADTISHALPGGCSDPLGIGASNRLSARTYWRPVFKTIRQMFWFEKRRNPTCAKAIGDVLSILDSQGVRFAHGKPEPTFKPPRRRARYSGAPQPTLAAVWPTKQ